VSRSLSNTFRITISIEDKADCGTNQGIWAQLKGLSVDGSEVSGEKEKLEKKGTNIWKGKEYTYTYGVSTSLQPYNLCLKSEQAWCPEKAEVANPNLPAADQKLGDATFSDMAKGYWMCVDINPEIW